MESFVKAFVEAPLDDTSVEAFISFISSMESSTALIYSMEASMQASIASISSMEASMKGLKTSTEDFISFHAKCK